MTTTRWTAILGMILVLLGAPSAHARQGCSQGTVSVAISPSNGGQCWISTVNGRQQVTLDRFANVTGTVDFLVTGSSTEAFDIITVQTNNSTYLTTVSVQGPSSGTTGSVEAVLKTGTGPVRLDDFRISGSLGANLSSGAAIDVDTVTTFVIGGNVSAPVAVVNSSFLNPSGVSGNFYANLTVSSGSILNLPITGDFGDPSGSAVTVTVGGDVVRLTANSFNVNMAVTGSIDTLRTPVNGADFKGALSAGDIEAVAGGSGDGFIIAGTLFANVVVSEVTLPVNIGSTDEGASFTIEGDVTLTTPDRFRVVSRNRAPITILGTLSAAMILESNSGSISVGSIGNTIAGIEIRDTETYTDVQDIFVAGACAGVIFIGHSFSLHADLRGAIVIGGDLTGGIFVRRGHLTS